jgi:hypothetical protein
MFTVWTAVTAWGCLVRIDVTASVCTPAMQCVSLRHYAVGLQVLWRSVMTRQRNRYGFLWQYVGFLAMEYAGDKRKCVAALQLSVCRWCGRLMPQGNKSCATYGPCRNASVPDTQTCIAATNMSCGQSPLSDTMVLYAHTQGPQLLLAVHPHRTCCHAPAGLLVPPPASSLAGSAAVAAPAPRTHLARSCRL